MLYPCLSTWFIILYQASSLWAFQLLSTLFLDSPEASGAVPGPLTRISSRVLGNVFHPERNPALDWEGLESASLGTQENFSWISSWEPWCWTCSGLGAALDTSRGPFSPCHPQSLWILNSGNTQWVWMLFQCSFPLENRLILLRAPACLFPEQL